MFIYMNIVVVLFEKRQVLFYFQFLHHTTGVVNLTRQSQIVDVTERPTSFACTGAVAETGSQSPIVINRHIEIAS